MKIFVAIIIAIALSGCAQKTTMTPQVEQNRRYITQVDVKMAKLERKMARLENIASKTLAEMRGFKETMQDMKKQQSLAEIKEIVPQEKEISRPEKTKVEKTVKTQEPLPELPVLVGREQPWADKYRKMSAQFIEKWRTKSLDDEGDSRWVGQEFPMTSFVNSDGQVLDLEEYRDKKNVLLVILRGFAGGVCLFCSSQTIALSHEKEKFRSKNTEVVVVYPGAVDAIPGFLESVKDLEASFELPFAIVLDPDLSLTRQLGIKSELAKPSSFIIDKNGIIQYAYVGKNAGDRPTIPDLLKQLDSF